MVRRDANYVYYHYRDKAHAALGGVCSRCGFTDIRALQIDHVNGDGCTLREGGKSGGHGTPLFKEVIASIQRGERRFQLLCANCNWIKRHENGERRNQYEPRREARDHSDDGPLFPKR